MGAPILRTPLYASDKRGLTPDVHALATLLRAASVLAAASVTWLRRRRL